MHRNCPSLVAHVDVSPSLQIQFRDKVIWTLMTLLIFLVSCQVPLYGVDTTSGSDPLYWMRVLMASNRCVPWAHLMYLSIFSPIVTCTGLFTQRLPHGARY